MYGRKAENQEDGELADATADTPMEDLAEVWLEPDAEKAQKLRAQAIFKEGTASLWTTSPEDLQIEMGPGISLYFIFLKMLFFYFCIASIVFMPAIICK